MDLFRDWFRTLLSLLGVCIGVFSIVAVFTCVDSLKTTIRESFESFGADILFVEKEPLEPDLNDEGVFRWWKYAGRPQVTEKEYRFLSENASLASATAYSVSFSNIVGICGDWDMIVQTPIASGRGFSVSELERGTSVVLIGDALREKLSAGMGDPLGRNIKIGESYFTVIGVFEKRGANAVSTVDVDNAMIVPYLAAAALADVSQARASIALAPKEGAQDNLPGEVRSLMRQVRRMSPSDEDNFAVNRFSFIIGEITEIFGMVNTLGWIIGLFSLLVGCFGVANIMFVSVQERIREIGIQKALGAKRRRILAQFLSEAAALSTLGGGAGVLLVWLGVQITPAGSVELHLTFANALLGLGISLSTGLVAGLAPALHAARLNPVDAINYCGS